MKIKRINFLQSSMRRHPSMGVDFLIDKSFIALVIVCALASIKQIYFSQIAVYEASQLKARGSVLDNAVQAAELANTQLTKRAKELEPVTAVLKRKILWSEALKELSGLISKDVWLEGLQSSFEKDSRSVTVTGLATSQEKVTGFFTDLENSYYFRNVLIKYSERKTTYSPVLYEFQFTATIPSFDAKVAQK